MKIFFNYFLIIFCFIILIQVSAEISSTIQEISNAVEPKPDSSHLDDLIQQIIKTVDAKIQETNMQSEDKPTTKKSKKKSKKTKSKK